MMFLSFQLHVVAPIGCLGGSPHSAPIQHHPRVPQGRGASTPGMPRPGGTGWTPPEQWAVVGTGCLWAANPLGLGAKALVTAGAEATPAPSSRTMVCPVFCQPGSSGWLSLAAGGDLMEPPHRLFCSGRSFPAFSSQLP